MFEGDAETLFKTAGFSVRLACLLELPRVAVKVTVSTDVTAVLLMENLAVDEPGAIATGVLKLTHPFVSSLVMSTEAPAAGALFKTR